MLVVDNAIVQLTIDKLLMEYLPIGFFRSPAPTPKSTKGGSYNLRSPSVPVPIHPPIRALPSLPSRAKRTVRQSNHDNYPFRKYYFSLAIVQRFKAITIIAVMHLLAQSTTRQLVTTLNGTT